MLKHKPQLSLYPVAVIVALVMSIMVTFGSLVEAIGRAESFL
jgi:hypothetical protein